MTAKTDPSTGNADMRRRRRLLRRLRRVVRVIEEQHRIQDIGYRRLRTRGVMRPLAASTVRRRC
jgi:hypothetical protein